MLFNSVSFLIFFPIVVAIYFIIPCKTRYIWLLVASYYFYMSWNAKYALLLAFSTLATWISGVCLDSINRTGRFFASPNPDEISQDDKQVSDAIKRRKRIFVVAICFIINLGILAFFKYFDFILHNINVTLSVFSIEPFEKPFDLLLPVGISFYTFQALSYTVDIYRGEVTAERNPFKYALFVSFFPQLVAGPIERSKNLLVQVERVASFKLWNLDRVTRGFILMVWGYFLKMVVADRCAVLVNHVYDNYAAYGQVDLFIATVIFGFQILCDFAGYSTIAIGAAKVMGFELMENFNTPYFATSIQDFWRRWHISLSTWFRDYLYFPLGGSRKGKWRTCLNIMIVFLVSGLWHGAAWTFVIWGFLHGIFQVIGRLSKPYKDRLWNKLHINTDHFLWRLGKVAVTFFLVAIAWVFFRATSFSQGADIVGCILTDWGAWSISTDFVATYGLSVMECAALVGALLVMFIVDLIRYRKGQNLADFLMDRMMGIRWFVMIALILAVAVFGVYGPDFDAAEFIYFQF